MLRFAIDGITSFSTVPLRMAIWLGVVAGCVALAGGLWAVCVKLFNRGVVPGWTTIMILVGMGSSAQLLMTGILGEYVGRIYEEVKRRPLYVVRDEIEPGRRWQWTGAAAGDRSREATDRATSADDAARRPGLPSPTATSWCSFARSARWR